MKNFLSKSKNLFVKLKTFLFAFLSFGFFSCNFWNDSINEPVKEYFKEYTETAGIMKYEISKGEWQLDSNGRISISSSQNAQITFYLRNPQQYEFSSANINLDFDKLDNSQIEKTLKNPAEKSLVQISQNSDDLMILKLEYPTEFLSQTETGFEISPEITLSHPVSKLPFETYSDLKLYSNSSPPPIYGATVYKDSSTNKYVLLFNMPEKSLLSGIHQDISEISVLSSSSGEVSSQVKIDSTNGTFTFENSSFVAGNVSSNSNYEKSSVDFVEKGQAAYFLTNDSISDENTNYTITLKDKSGLSSQVQTNVYSVKLGEVQILNSSDALVSSGDYLEQDEGSSYATVSFKPAENSMDDRSGQTFNTADSSVIYEIYQGENDSGKLLLSGKNSSGLLTLQIPSGAVFIRLYAHKDLFADSDVKEYSLQVLKSTIYVSPTGSDDFNNGSASSPYATISKAINEFSHIEKRAVIYLEGDILDSPELSIANANLIIHGNGHSISDFTMTSKAGGTFVADNLSIKNKLSVSSGNLAFDGSSVDVVEISNGIVEFNEGSLGSVKIEDGSFESQNVNVNGKLEVLGGNVDLTSGTFSDIYLSGGTLKSSDINATGNLEIKNGSADFTSSSLSSVEISVGSANFTNTSVSGETKISNGSANFTGGSVAALNVSSGSADFTNTSVSGKASLTSGTANFSSATLSEVLLSGGTLTLKDSVANANVNYSGGKLTLEGSTKVLSSSKITMSQNLEISVKNLSESFVAHLAAENSFDTWQKGTSVLNFESDNNLSPQETVQKFTLESSKWILIADSGGQKGVLGTSDANLEIKEFIVEFSAEPQNLTRGQDQSVNVKASVKLKSNKQNVDSTDSDFTDWNLSLNFQNVEVTKSSSSSIPISKDYPAGTYTLKISAKYKGIYYNSTLEIKLTEATK